MSFTVQVKEELLLQSSQNKSELSAIIKLSGSLGLASSGLTLSISTENAKIARHIYELLLHFYQIKAEIRHHQKPNLKKNRVYAVLIEDGVNEILNDLHLADSFFGLETGISPLVLENDSWSQAYAYLRGAFLAAGSVKDPEKGKYQLEIASVYSDHANDLANLMQKFLLDAKVIERSKGTITYLQRAEDIMDFLLVIGAEETKTEFENVKLLREARNDLNRATNAEAANIAKTVNASMKTINNIIKIMDTIGLDQLSGDLQEIAQLRIQHPDYSIQQLADSLTVPITKSGVNHRLRKINKIADELTD
ncbi:DNA-binding protein WhiA [Streptococcus suis]|nr:DNA-binding protein WhiA [Streptococcus suis]MBS0784076.1 DNA-binding protein WhiA [Streptococcus suis]